MFQPSKRLKLGLFLKDPPLSPSIGQTSAVGAAMADCEEMAANQRKTQFGLSQNIRQLGGGGGTSAGGAEVGAGQGGAGVGVPWKVNGAVVVPMENDQNNNNGGDGGEQNARNGGQNQQLQKILSLQQRKTVAQMPNFNGAVSGYDGGPFSVGGGTSAAADGGRPWRQHQKPTPPLMVAQQNAVVQQQGNAGHWQMPKTNGVEGRRSGGEKISDSSTHGEMPEEKTPPIQNSATSLQALSQQIRRLPAVLYADSRKSDSRQLEVLLRDGYGLPLVTFYADKIGLEHIKKYHEQKQMPRLVEFEFNN